MSSFIFLLIWSTFNYIVLQIYRHTTDKGVTLRSFKAVTKYENNKKLLGIEKEKFNTMEVSTLSLNI